MGSLILATLLVPLGLLKLCPLQIWIQSLHLKPKWHKHKKVRVSGHAFGVISSHREVAKMDVSLSRWEVLWQHRVLRGGWDAQQRLEYVYVLKLQAILLQLQQLLPVVRHLHGLLRTNNCSPHQPPEEHGTESKQCLQVVAQLLTWVFSHFLRLRAAHLPGVQNTATDLLSFKPQHLRQVWKGNGHLFASEETTHYSLRFFQAEETSPPWQGALAHGMVGPGRELRWPSRLSHWVLPVIENANRTQGFPVPRGIKPLH